MAHAAVGNRAGPDTPLVLLIDERDRVLAGSTDAAACEHVHAGAPVEVRALDGRTLVRSRLEAAVTTFDGDEPRCDVIVPLPRGRIALGREVEAVIALPAVRAARSVPLSAVEYVGGRASVRIVRRGLAIAEPVELGRADADHVEISLPPGTVVAIP